MFDLEESIAAWREEMSRADVKRPEVLDELEGHLREDVEEQKRVGTNEGAAFERAVERIGRGELLKIEFTKAEAAEQKISLRFAGVDQNYTGEIMSLEKSNLESRWATYGKAIAFAGPAIMLWLFAVIFLLPKANQICLAAHLTFPSAFRTALALTESARANLSIIVVAAAVGVALLEWRSGLWARHRKLYFGMGVFAVNSVVLVSITLMLTMVLISANALMNHVN
jgi:hypothetical protein